MTHAASLLLAIAASAAVAACSSVAREPAPVEIRTSHAQPQAPASVYWAEEASQPRAAATATAPSPDPRIYAQAHSQWQAPAAVPQPPTALSAAPYTVVSRRVVVEDAYPQLEIGGPDDETPVVTRSRYSYPAREQAAAVATPPSSVFSHEYRLYPEDSATPTPPTNAAPRWMPATPVDHTSPASSPAPAVVPTPTAAARPVSATPRTLVVRQGDTLYSLAQRNRVSLDALMQTNGLREGDVIRIGQVLRLPGNSAITVQPGDTLFAIGRRLSVHPKSLAAFNGLSEPYTLQPGQVLYVPAIIADAQGATVTPVPAWPAIPPVPPASRGPVTLEGAPAAPAAPVTAPPLDVSPSGFVWPVSGAVVQEFGAHGQGKRNDGINIAVPVGTPVRAAAPGTVSYVGDEIRGYGRLILITHDDGYVTAYAHLSEYLVKESDSVAAGQVIGRSGETGAVASPQLHFEIRQRGNPLDPRTRLPSRTA